MADVTKNIPVSGPNMEELGIPIATLPNLRRVDSTNKIFRSSRQDLVSPEDCKKLNQLGIRTILDFRSPSEYKRASGNKLFDANTEIVSTLVPSKKNRDSPIRTKKVTVNPPGPEYESRVKRRYLFDFFQFNYIKAVFVRATWYQQLISLLYLIVDLIMRNHFKYFVRYFGVTVLNPAGLGQQYIDILEYSSTQIQIALRLLSEPENLPALISCAHGKDRTGIVVALVQLLLGKSTDYVAEEYALSEIGLQGIRQRVEVEIIDRFHFDESFTHARKETMLTTLQYIYDTYGSVESYLEYIGLGKEDQEKLKQALEAE
ncbi:uncharacterized protein [Amphiura filiformis]|uniref:uncharacterized protein n=1 Tax=Amphiura filiformis TaxID=82378 RepID=UPI003B21A563